MIHKFYLLILPLILSLPTVARSGNSGPTPPPTMPAAASPSTPEVPITNSQLPLTPPTDHGLDWPMRTDPLLTDAPQVKEFAPELKSLWLQALARPDAETKRQAADAFAAASAKGMTDLESAAPALLAALDAKGAHPIVKLSCAQALIQINYKPAAASLLAHASSPGSEGLDMLLLADPALARWNHQPAREAWRKRFADPLTPRQSLISAMRALAVVRDAEALPLLNKVLLDVARDPATRLVAAQSLAAIASKDHLNNADTLYASGKAPLSDRLLAVTLLTTSSGKDVCQRLQVYATDSEPAVVAIALRRLLDIDPGLVTVLNPLQVKNPDPNVRLLIAEGLLKQKSPQSVELLTHLLNDISSKVRTYSREALISLDTEASLRHLIRTTVAKQLRLGQWRAIEQAAYVLASVDEKSAADVFVQLLQFEKPEVRIAAVVGLRRLAVAETIAPAFARAQSLAEKWQQSIKDPKAFTMRTTERTDEELAQLLQFLGFMRHPPADALFRRFIPKHCGFAQHSRQAAIWALGMLHENRPQADLANVLFERAADSNIMDPELSNVREASAVTLGRMNAVAKVNNLKGLFKNETSPRTVQLACRWAILRLTQKTYDELPPATTSYTGWFIEPIK